MAKKADDFSPYSYDGAVNFPARLQKLAKSWQKIAEPSLKNRQALLKLVASGFYESAHQRRHTLNLIDRGVSTVVPFLIEGDPSILVETMIAGLRPEAYTTQLALNYLIKKMKLAETVFIPVAWNSMFGAGCTRTSFVYDRLINLDDEQVKLGTPGVDVIDDSNYIGDPSAKRRADFTFEGDVYQLPTEYARDFFAKKVRGKQIADHIKSDSKLSNDFSPKDISRPDFDRHKLSLREYTTFIDLYLRDENVTVTIMPEGKKAVILREVEWDGPEGGPYDYLSYKCFPDEPIPIPPAWSWHDIDVTVNKLVDKMREQAESYKTVLAYEKSVAEKDAKALVEAVHQQVVGIDGNPNEVLKTVELGGVNPQNFQWVQFMLMEQTKQGANPDVLGGRGSSAPTLGQEQMLFNNATRIVGNMYTRYQDFMTSVLRKLAWAYWTMPDLYVPIVKEVPGVAAIPVVWSSATRTSEFTDFVFEIVPYSTQRMSPETRYSRMFQFASQWLLPTMQFAGAQGAQLDIPTASKILASYAGLDNFNQWYKTATPEPMDAINFTMKPAGASRPGGGTGQMNDSFGALQGSRESNLGQQQNREGSGAETDTMLAGAKE
jgi:hypothetical protein